MRTWQQCAAAVIFSNLSLDILLKAEMILDSPAVVVFSKFPNHFPASLLQNLGFQAQKFSVHCPADLCFNALSDRKWVWVYKAQVNHKLSWQSGRNMESNVSLDSFQSSFLHTRVSAIHFVPAQLP